MDTHSNWKCLKTIFTGVGILVLFQNVSKALFAGTSICLSLLRTLLRKDIPIPSFV